MKKLSDYFKTSSSYWGERGEWLVAATINRDSGCLDRSNYHCFIQLLGGNGSEGAKGNQQISENVAIEEATHWACGWLQYLVINPAAADLVTLAGQTLEKLENYPVLNEEDFSELEMEEANQVWKNCYQPKERAKYIREHSSQFEFRGLADLLGCVRGKYFAGYASELLN